MSSRFSSSCFSCYLFLLLVSASFHFCLSSNRNFDDVLCLDGEKRALLEFKHGLIDEAGRLASWDEIDCCRWAGITCDNFTRHVHRIHLPGLDVHRHDDYETSEVYNEASKRRLGGNLSSSLLRLKQLRHLDLSRNDFGGIQVPSFIGSIRNLRYLNLSHSGFGEILPPQLGNLSNLHVLCLGNMFNGNKSSSMTSIHWLSSLRLLNHLDMSGIDLSKAIDWFQVMNTLPSLAELHLSNCQLSHIHPHVSSLNITSLSLLDLSGNYFDTSSVPRWIFSIKSLVSLDISGCNFHHRIPSSIDSFRNLTALKFLHVSGNDFMSSSLVLKSLSSVGGNLVLLDISSCGVSSPVLDVLRNSTSLLSLDLSHNQLTKPIPKSMGNLCNLRKIDLSGNDFRNTSFTHLLESVFECKSPRLESLSLTNSRLSGHLPDSIGQLSLLRSFVLSQNLVFGPIPYSIGGLSSLEVLDLSHNQLNGSLPDSLGQLSNLDFIDFSHNLLTGIVTKAHLAKTTSLKYLNGEGNHLIFRPQHLNWIPPFQLQSLYLNSWDLGPQFLLWLQSQRDLIYLDISNTNISAPMPHSFWSSFPNLLYLDMSQNRLQGTLFSIPATLDMIDLSSNEFIGQLPELSNSSGPYFLDLSNNSFVGSLHHLLCPDDKKSTGVLSLGNNNLSGVVPECWVKWQSLVFLNLENNNLSGEVSRTLGFSSSLVSLNMCGNKLSGRLPALLTSLTNLEFLQLGRNELVGSIPTWLGRKLSDLRSLNLKSNNFDGNIPQELCYLTKIHILDLSHNYLSGSIPRCLNNFSILSGKESGLIDAYMFHSVDTKDFLVSDSFVIKGREDIYSTILPLVMMMDLSGNNFVGHIPSELTALRELKSLNLSRNQLIGRIPEKIGDMKSLESFDLSFNELSGELPASLSSLSFLSNFNVSNNNFTGRIPSSTQLQTLNESSFFGNNLCGDPLTKQCLVDVANIDQKEEDDDDKLHGADWGLIVSVVVGFVAGFWIIVAPLMVSRSWRNAYFHFLTRLRYMAYDVMQKYCCNMFPK